MFFYYEKEIYEPFSITEWALQYEQNFETMPTDLIYYYVNNSGANEQIIDNSTLSYPLTQTGQKCFNLQVNNSAWEASVNQSNIIGIQDTKAISVRSWVRIAGGGDTETLIGIAAKKTLASGGFLGSGYTLRIETGYKGNNFTLGYGGVRNLVIGTINPHDKWIRLRLDVIPDSVLGDKLIGYYTEQEDENWQQIGEIIIPKDSGQYLPWGNNSSYQGLYVRDGQSSGWWYNNYFDNLQVYTANILK